MTPRIEEWYENATTATSAITILHEALIEATDLLRKIDSPDARVILRTFASRNLITSPEEDKLGDMQHFLVGAVPPPCFTPSEWYDLYVARCILADLLMDEPEKTQQALNNATLRGWFVGQLLKQIHPDSSGPPLCGRLVGAVFSVGMR